MAKDEKIFVENSPNHSVVGKVTSIVFCFYPSDTYSLLVCLVNRSFSFACSFSGATSQFHGMRMGVGGLLISAVLQLSGGKWRATPVLFSSLYYKWGDEE